MLVGTRIRVRGGAQGSIVAFQCVQKKRVPDLLSRTADRWRLGCSTEPWPTIDISYHKSADSPVLAVQKRAKRAYFYRQARSFTFCTSAELARIPRTQVQSSRHVLAGRSKPRRSHHTTPLARAPCRTFARSPPSPHGPSQQAQPELHLRQTSTVPSPHGPSSAPSLPLQHGRHQLRYARMSKAADSNYSSPAPPAKLIFSGRRTSP